MHIRYRQGLAIFSIVTLFCICTRVWGEEKTVVYLNSYHAGYDWSDKEFDAFKVQLSDKDVNIHQFYMNTKHIKKSEDITLIVKEVLSFIDEHQPDILVAADDNASKYIIQPHFGNAEIPVVFLGVNLDATTYGYPYINSTGMVEQEGLINLIKVIRQYTNYKNVTMFFTPSTTSMKKYHYYKNKISDFDAVVVKNVNEFKVKLADLKGRGELVALDTLNGLDDFNALHMQRFLAEQHGQAVISVSNSSQNLAHFGYIKVPEEHGIWAGEAVQKIFSGVKVSDIPSAFNSHYQVFINKDFAKRCAVIIPDVFYKLPFIQINE